jgi:hypothetical protein
LVVCAVVYAAQHFRTTQAVLPATTTATLHTASDGFSWAIRNDAIDIATLVGLSTTTHLACGALLVGGHPLKTGCSASRVAAT